MKMKKISYNPLKNSVEAYWDCLDQSDNKSKFNYIIAQDLADRFLSDHENIPSFLKELVWKIKFNSYLKMVGII